MNTSFNMDSLYVRTLQDATSVSSAGSGSFSSERHQLMIDRQSCLQLCELCDDELKTLKNWPLHKRIELSVVVQQPDNPSSKSYILIITADDQCSLLAVESSELRCLAYAPLAYGQRPQSRRLGGVCSSRPYVVQDPGNQGAISTLVAVAAYQDIIHILQIIWKGAETELAVLPLAAKTALKHSMASTKGKPHMRIWIGVAR